MKDGVIYKDGKCSIFKYRTVVRYLMQDADPKSFVLAVMLIGVAEKVIEFLVPYSQITLVIGGLVSITFSSLIFLVAGGYLVLRLMHSTPRKPYTKSLPNTD